MPNYKTLEITAAGDITGIWLNRPEVRNAFNADVIAELTSAFRIISRRNCRIVLLGGRGKVFCAGADLNWMRAMAAYSEEQNLADALALADMLEAVDSCPWPVVARVQRAAFGGALGLLACCDSVICGDDALFAFSEVRLGISPATISPYVVAKIGASGARDLFLSGEKFNADRALRIGLVHQVAPADRLDKAVDSKLGELLRAGPQAAMETKKLVRSLTATVDSELRHTTAALIARLRVSAEGQEGLGAFLEKTKPGWVGDEHGE
jgi:methylglutaconyl-CoA hydratase